MSAIEKALLEATGGKPQKASEDRQKFLVRLLLAVGKLPDDEWEKLAAVDGAQEWHTKATDADNADRSVPDFPDAEEAEADEPEAEEAETETEDDDADADDDETQQEEKVRTTKVTAADKTKGAKGASKKPAADKAPAKKAAPNGKDKPAAKAAPTKQAKPDKKVAKPTSMRRTLKMIVIKKPKMPTDELIAKLEEKGFKSPSKLTVTSIRSDTRDTIKVLNEAGITEIEL